MFFLLFSSPPFSALLFFSILFLAVVNCTLVIEKQSVNSEGSSTKQQREQKSKEHRGNKVQGVRKKLNDNYNTNDVFWWPRALLHSVEAGGLHFTAAHIISDVHILTMLTMWSNLAAFWVKRTLQHGTFDLWNQEGAIMKWELDHAGQIYGINGMTNPRWCHNRYHVFVSALG